MAWSQNHPLPGQAHSRLSPRASLLPAPEVTFLCHKAWRTLPPFLCPMSPLKVRSAPWTVVTSKLNLGPCRLVTGAAQAHLFWKAEGAHRNTISQSIFQSLTSICGLRLVFVSPYFVFFFMMNGYCQASLEEVIGRRRGAGRRQHSGGGLGGVCVGFLVGLLLTFLFIG